MHARIEQQCLHRNTGTEEQWVQRNIGSSAYRGTVGTEQRRNKGYTGQNNSRYGGTVGIEGQSNTRCGGTVGTKD